MTSRNYPFGLCDILDEGSVIIQDGSNTVVSLEVLGEAYHEFAKAGVAALKTNTWFCRSKSLSAAYIALPVLFTYRHAVELYLKAMVIAGRPLLASPPNDELIYHDHNLEKLRPYVEEIFARLKWGWNTKVDGLRSVHDFRRLVGRFGSLDHDSTKTRFTVTTSGKTAWKDWKQINVFEIAKALDPVLAQLGQVASTIQEVINENTQAEAEAREYYAE